MPINHASAIIRWRDYLDMQPGGLEAFDQNYTVTTMLFGCHQWLEKHNVVASPEEKERIETIKVELERWMEQRGLTFTG